MFGMVRKRSRPFVSVLEQLTGGQRGTLGKVTDERAVEEGSRQVALKKSGKGRKTSKIDHSVKKIFKDPLSEKKSMGHKSRLRDI